MKEYAHTKGVEVWDREDLIAQVWVPQLVDWATDMGLGSLQRSKGSTIVKLESIDDAESWEARVGAVV